MAEAWGGNVRNWRGGVAAWVQSETSTTATIRVVARWQSLAYGFNVANGNTACVSCDGQSSGWVGVGGVYAGRGQTVTKDMLVRDFTVAKHYGDGRNVGCYGGFHLGGFQVGDSGANCNVWIGGIPYSAPKPPVGFTAERESDDVAVLKWSGDYTGMDGAYPWSNVLIERRIDAGGWGQIRELNWDATSFRDSISAGHRYGYRVRSKGPGGHSGYVECPAYVYTTPTAPSGCTAVRKSDSRADVSWRIAANAAESYKSVLLDRRIDEGGWVQIATLGPSATNYTDNGISANHRYQYRVRAYNGLYSVFSESGYIYTTPAAPSSVSASATGPTKVAVAAGGLAPYAAEHQVEHRSASGDWGGSKTAGTFPVDMPSVAGLNYYRVRSGRDGLWSGWCESKGITTVAVPLKPTVSGLPAVYALGADAVVSWTPNHPDGSAQTSAELEVTDPGASTTTVSVEGDGGSASVTLGAVGTWRFRVRTHGAHPDWGAWSGYAEVAVAAPPVITVTSPSTDSAVAEVVPFAATWDVADVTGVASQTLRLLSSDGSPLHAVELGGDVREYEFRAGTYLPANLDAYSIELSVRGGSTLSATATRRFTTDYAAPAAPIATVEYTPELGTEVTVIYGRDARASDGGSGPVIPTESASVVRAMPDGTQWLVSDGMGDGEKARDPLPPLETGFKYLVTAYSEVGTATTVEVPAFVRADAVAINFGRAASGFIPLKYDVEWSRDYELSTELMDFADGGEAGGLPTAYTTGSASIKGSLSATSLGREDHDALDALARRHAVAWVRDPHGRRALCAIGLGLSGGVPRDVAGVNLSLTETAWREAWDG